VLDAAFGGVFPLGVERGAVFYLVPYLVLMGGGLNG
jgi:hypothetical protein